MLTPHDLYQGARDFLAPSWSLMTVLAAVIVGVTIALWLHRDPVLLAGWLVWLISP